MDTRLGNLYGPKLKSGGYVQWLAVVDRVDFQNNVFSQSSLDTFNDLTMHSSSQWLKPALGGS